MVFQAAALQPPTDVRDRIIVALDVDSAAAARELVQQLEGRVAAFKIGLQLYTAAGPAFVSELTRSGIKVFLDLKFHDIPNTVARASAEAAKLGVWMINLHASGGSEMMRRTAEEVSNVCSREGLKRPLIIAVTILTSSDQSTLNETGVLTPVKDQVVRLAELAAASGLDGVVASALEAAAVKRTVQKPGFCIVTPGIRHASGTRDDQRRVTTVRDACANGSDYVVIGRPITQAAHPAAAVEDMLSNCDAE